MEQRIFTNFTGRNFTQIKNEAVQNKELSWKARGILTFLASMPSDWVIYKNEIMTHSTDKRDSFNSGWNELKTAGYIKGVQVREKGKFKEYVWYVSDEKMFKEPEVDNPYSDKPDYGLSATTNTNITNTEYTNTIDTEIDTKEMFLRTMVNPLISEKTANLFLIFGNELEAKKYLDIIFKTKSHVERLVSNLGREYKIEGDLWLYEIENTGQMSIK